MKRDLASESSADFEPPSGKAWDIRDVETIHREDLDALLSGEIAYIRVGGFLSGDWCADIVKRFLSSADDPNIFDRYFEGWGMSRALGIPFRADCDRDDYFARAETANRSLRQIYAGGEDPLSKLQKSIEIATGWSYFQATEGGRAYGTDHIWALEKSALGCPIHADGFEPSGLVPLKSRRMLSWNVYLAASESGGGLAVYRKRWTKEDDQYRKRANVGYDPAVIRDCPYGHIRPRPGDLVIFDPTHCHNVFKTAGPSRRTSAQAYIGLDRDRKEFTFWA